MDREIRTVKLSIGLSGDRTFRNEGAAGLPFVLDSTKPLCEYTGLYTLSDTKANTNQLAEPIREIPERSFACYDAPSGEYDDPLFPTLAGSFAGGELLLSRVHTDKEEIVDHIGVQERRSPRGRDPLEAGGQVLNVRRFDRERPGTGFTVDDRGARRGR